MFPLPKIPWQLTGNHWVSVPCIHPIDGSIHAVGVVRRALRGAVEFAGSEHFIDGAGQPLLQLGVSMNGVSVELGACRLAWQRLSEWIPTFNATVEDMIVRGTIFAPVGQDAEAPGFVYALSFENRGSQDMTIALSPHGVLGVRNHRITTPRPFDDAHTFVLAGDSVILTGASPQTGAALAMAMDGAQASAERRSDGTIAWLLRREFVVAPGVRTEVAIYVAVGSERDGAAAMLAVMRQRGLRALAEQTRTALGSLEQTTGVLTADRLVNRHLMFAYFYGVARAIDDAQMYLVRSRAPWHSKGMTVRDWDALMWTIPAVQLADPDLARELILRMCEVHGYAPGRGVNYLNGAPFSISFCLDGAASYALAVDRYIAQTGDNHIVEEPALADALYISYEEIHARRHATIPLYSTDVTLSGCAAELPYTLHANSVIAEALDIFRQTLDEKTAEKIEDGKAVRDALECHFIIEDDNDLSIFVAAVDLLGGISLLDDTVGSAYWIPMYDAFDRDNPVYQRTVKQLDAASSLASRLSVVRECAQLIGPHGAAVLDRLRRATMDNGVAAEAIDSQGNAIDNGGDAALSGLIAYTVWYAVNALGVRI